MPALILASASPRRRDILSVLGVEFEVVVPEIEEIRHGAAPEELVIENARRKARVGLELAGAVEAVVLGVDTDVVLDEATLGKAESADEARERLEALSGRTHEVLSGVALMSAGAAPERSGVARSWVTFRELDRATIERYVASGEWRDRAGAYAIQGLGSFLIERLEGDFSNVVGLPLQLLLSLAPELFPKLSS